MSIQQANSQPPLILKMLSHPLRWQMLKALAASDLRVSELVDLVRQPQNVVSYHLSQMRAQRIIHVQRSIADARELYYSIDLDHVRELFFASGDELHPALSPDVPVPVADEPSLARRVRVLFLCTHNSARSQMAEGILRHLAEESIVVFSAGVDPTSIHPLAIRVLKEQSIDPREQYSKSLDQLIGQSFDYVITVCDRTRETCPVFPGDPVKIHWSFPDPAEVEGNERARYMAFKETAVQLTTRISYLLLVIRRSHPTLFT